MRSQRGQTCSLTVTHFDSNTTPANAAPLKVKTVIKYQCCWCAINLHFPCYSIVNFCCSDHLLSCPLLPDSLGAAAATEVVSFIKTEPPPPPRRPVVCNEALKHLGCSRRAIRDGWCEFGADIEAIREVGWGWVRGRR